MSPLKLLSLPFLILACMLSGCAKEQSAAAVLVEISSRGYTPQDTSIAALYNRSCRSCHTIAATGAPLTGDSAAWSIRMTKGLDVLVDNVVNGFGGMPPLGMCMDCEIEDFEALIVFMAEAGGAIPTAND